VSAARCGRVAVFCLLALGAGGPSLALELSELQRLLQSAPVKSIAFSEVRESPWLAQPVESRGSLESKAGVLEKRVEAPRREVWRMLPDRVEYLGDGDAAGKQILFSQSPAVAMLADTWRRVAAGDLLALQRDFRITLHGDQRAWSVRLQPVGADAVRHLDHLHLEGAGADLLIITVVDRQGERTTTRLYP
jgi:hypothetical protein